jgi:hypothetical protein
MVVLVMLGTFALMATMVPGGLAAMRNRNPESPSPTPAYLAANLALSLLAAVLGGVVTRKLAPASPDGHLLALGCAVVAMGVVSAVHPGSQRQPGWYKVVIPIVGLIGVAGSRMVMG